MRQSENRGAAGADPVDVNAAGSAPAVNELGGNMIQRILESLRRHRPTDEERVIELREHKEWLREQTAKTNRKIDDIMVQRIRTTGL